MNYLYIFLINLLIFIETISIGKKISDVKIKIIDNIIKVTNCPISEDKFIVLRKLIIFKPILEINET